MPHLLGEFRDYEHELLVKDRLPGPLSPKKLSPSDLLHEIKLHLKGGRASKRLSVAPQDVLTVQRNLRRLLDQAEEAGGRPAVAAAYSTSAEQDPAEVYKYHKSRYASVTDVGPLEMNFRFALARAACSILKCSNAKFDETAALLQIVGPTALSYVRFNAETDALLDAGRAVSDAWFAIVQALDSEIGLSNWFASVPTVVNDAAGLVADLLVVQTSACVPALPDDDLTIEALELPSHVTAPDPVDLQDYNFARHPHDDALAPSVTLFSLAMVRIEGRLEAARSTKAGRRAVANLWREVVLQILPAEKGGALPCLTLVPRISLNAPDGSPIRLLSPMSRPLGERYEIPVLLDTWNELAWFRPDKPDDIKAGASGLAFSFDSVFQTAWLASAGATAILLRMIADDADRPINPRIVEIAERNPDLTPLFAKGTVGNFIERATFVANRAYGIGGLLREDFYRRDHILRERGIVVDPSRSLTRFYRCWHGNE